MYPPEFPTVRNQPLPDLSESQGLDDTSNILLSRTPPPSPQLPAVPGYQLLAFIGSGGMGVVYKARHLTLQRTVALKMLHEFALTDEESRERFQAEAEAVARAQHPNIIQVFEIGTVEDANGQPRPRPFLSLEFMEGGCLTRFTETPQSPAFSARLVEKLARAAHAAHLLGVVHRDLKPANVLLTKDGEPKIADFGVAKLCGQNERLLTQAGMTVGTPEYMAPEQSAGEEASPAADIYSLGVILYQLLTARLPFHGSNPVDTMYLVRNEEAVSPRRFQPNLPRDLETICMKCLAKKPGRRYATAEDLANDLVRWSEGRTILARPVGSFERSLMWVRRNPVVAVLSVAIVVVTFIGLTGIVWKWKDAEREAGSARAFAANADAERRKAQLEQRDAIWASYRANLLAASSALQLNNPSAARRALESAPEHLRGWEWRYFTRSLDTSRQTLGGPGAPVRWIAQPDDRTTILTIGEDSTARFFDVLKLKQTHQVARAEDFSRSAFNPRCDRLAIIKNEPDDRRIVIRDLRGGEPDRVLPEVSAQIVHHRYSPDGTQIAVATLDGWLRLLDADSGKVLQAWKPHDVPIFGVAFNADGSQIATAGGTDRTARIWDTKTLRCLHTLGNHSWNADSVTFNPAGDRLVVASWYPANKLWLWDLKTGETKAELGRHLNQIKWYGFNADGSRLASVSTDQTVQLWDGRDGQHVREMHGHTGWIMYGAFSPDGTRLVTGSQDRSLQLWSAANGDHLASLFGHQEEVLSVGFTADGGTIVSGSRDGTVKLWDARDAETTSRISGHTNFVYGVAFHPDGERIASASWDGTIRIWHATSGRELKKLVCGKNVITAHVAIHPEGKWLASLSRDNSIRLWDIDTGAELHRWSIKSDSWQDSRLTFSRDGRLLACGDNDFVVHLWDVANRSVIAQLKGHTRCIRDLAFSPDGKRLATASEDGDCTVRIWNVETRECEKVLEKHKTRVYSLAFNREGTLLASGCVDGKIELWSAATWENQGHMEHGAGVYSLAFDFEGKRLVSGCADNSVRIWDVETRTEVAELRGHTDYVHSVAFSPDGSRLISGSGDKSIRVWDTLTPHERLKASSPTRP